MLVERSSNSTEEAAIAKNAFTIRQLLTWTAMAAVFFTLATNLANNVKSIAAGLLVAIAFVLIDARRSHREIQTLSLALLACGLAYCVAAMFFTLLYFPDPVPPKPPMPFLAGVIYMASGAWIEEIFTAIARAIAMIVTYVLTFLSFTILSTSLALIHFRKRGGWKIVLANAPGLLLICYIAVVAIIASIFE